MQDVTVGYDDDGRMLALDVHVLARQRRVHPVRHHLPIITSTQLLGPYKTRRLPGGVRVASTPTPSSSPPTAGPAGRRAVRDGADDGPDRRALGLDRAEVRRAQLHPARRVPLRPPPDVPGRPAARSTTPGTTRARWRSSRSWSAGTRSRRAGRGRARAGRQLGIGMAMLRRGHRRRAVRGRARAGAEPRQGQGRDRADVAGPGPRDGRSPRSSPTSSACRSRTSRSSPATPGGSATRSAPSRRGPR